MGGYWARIIPHRAENALSKRQKQNTWLLRMVNNTLQKIIKGNSLILQQDKKQTHKPAGVGFICLFVSGLFLGKGIYRQVSPAIRMVAASLLKASSSDFFQIAKTNTNVGLSQREVVSFLKAGGNFLLMPFWLMKVSKGMLYFWMVGQTCSGICSPPPTSIPTPQGTQEVPTWSFTIHPSFQQRGPMIWQPNNDPLKYLKYKIKNYPVPFSGKN